MSGTDESDTEIETPENLSEKSSEVIKDKLADKKGKEAEKSLKNMKGNTELENGSSLQHKTILLDHLNLITKFSGNDPAILFTDFMSSFLGIAKFLAWDNEDKIFALKTRLTGEAARLIKNQPETRKFEELKSILEERFTKTESPTAALQKFLAFKQPPGMKVKDFFERASDMSYKALIYEGCDKKVTEQSRLAILKAMLLKNLAPEIRQGVVARDPKNPNEILRYALREEKGWESIRENDGISDIMPPGTQDPVNNRYPNFAYACTNSMPEFKSNREIAQDLEIEFLKRQVESLERQLKEIRYQENIRTPYNPNAPTQSNLAPIQCYACYGWNHLARHCPNRNNNGNYEQKEGRGRGGRYPRGNRNRGSRHPFGHYQTENRERVEDSGTPEAPLPQVLTNGETTTSHDRITNAIRENNTEQPLNMSGQRQK